jgi:hypothetical protein
MLCTAKSQVTIASFTRFAKESVSCSYWTRTIASASIGTSNYYFPHRAAAAFLAIAFRFLSLSDAARALPPLLAPSLDSATACGFFCGGASGSPITASMVRTAI